MIETINILIRKLYNTIPMPILELAFKPKENNVSLDSLIHEKVIQDMVLVDCNLYAGKITRIALKQEWLKVMESSSSEYALLGGNYTVYEVPIEATEGRSIGHVLDLSYPSMLSYHGTYPMLSESVSSVSAGMDNLLGSYSNRDNYVTPTPVLRGNNIVELLPAQVWSHHEWLLSCLLSYDKDFSNISANMILPLFECVKFAAQQYIYNNLIISLDSAALSAGQELSSIRSIIENYSGAEADYKEALLTWRGSATFDKDTMIGLFSEMLS